MYAIQNRRAFSLIELVIVIVIIGIIGAIAIPRMSRGAAGAADSALTANLAVLRNAIDLYQTEHGGAYPTYQDIEAQLLTYTDDAGNPGTRSSTNIFGPYLRVIPPLPVGENKGSITFTDIRGPGGGWFYDEESGTIRANTASTEVDARGIEYWNY